MTAGSESGENKQAGNQVEGVMPGAGEKTPAPAHVPPPPPPVHGRPVARAGGQGGRGGPGRPTDGDRGERGDRVDRPERRDRGDRGERRFNPSQPPAPPLPRIEPKPALPLEMSEKANLEQEIEAALGGASIEDLMAQAVSEGTPAGPTLDPSRPVRGGRPRAGRREREEGGVQPDNIKHGKVVVIRGGQVFVDLGGKSQGMCPLEQFDQNPPNAAGEVPKAVEIGQDYEFIYKGYDKREGLVLLARKGAVIHGAWETLQVGDIVEGEVTGMNKGGLELKVNNARAFMPAGQVDTKFNPDLSVFLNQRLTAIVTRVDRHTQNIILSRRDLVAQEEEKNAEKIWEELSVGQVREGTVRSVQPYGAFVDLGGVDGLLHVSAMSHVRVTDPNKIVHTGDKVQVMVLGVDKEKRKVSLGLKQLTKDPWDETVAQFGVGTTVAGTVKKIMDFGAFVELAPGVEGLVHISQIATRRIGKVSEVVKEGDTVKAKILQVDLEKRRISLSMAEVEREERAAMAAATAASTPPADTGVMAGAAGLIGAANAKGGAATKPGTPARKTPLKGGLS